MENFAWYRSWHGSTLPKVLHRPNASEVSSRKLTKQVRLKLLKAPVENTILLFHCLIEAPEQLVLSAPLANGLPDLHKQLSHVGRTC